MTKDELLAEVRRLAATGEISRTELVAAFSEVRGDSAPHPRFAVSQVLYFVGGLIIVIGIVNLVVQNWEILPAVVRILVTLGTAIALYVAGVLLTFGGHRTGATLAFLILSALLTPLGMGVTLNEVGIEWWRAGPQALQAGLFTVIFLLSRIGLRQTFFTFFTFVAGTWAYYAFLTWFLPDTAYTTLRIDLLYAYATIILGVAYVILGFGFRKTSERHYTDLLHVAGLFAFFGAAFSLAGYDLLTPTNVLWEVLLPGLTAGAIIASIPLRSKVFLFVGALALAADLVKLTSQYFPSALGWPVTLILVGFIIVGIGYGTYHLNRRFLATAPTS